VAVVVDQAMVAVYQAEQVEPMAEDLVDHLVVHLLLEVAVQAVGGAE
jgi:hypothetical protein